MEILGLGTALKILFTKDILSVDMFERNEILALIVTLGKYSDAIQFIEEMEQQIELNKLKANIQGYVDIDNEMKNVNIDTKVNSESDYKEEFNRLINNTFKNVFEANGFDSCQEWGTFCNDDDQFKLNQDIKNSQIATSVCDLFGQYCTN